MGFEEMFRRVGESPPPPKPSRYWIPRNKTARILNAHILMPDSQHSYCGKDWDDGTVADKPGDRKVCYQCKIGFEIGLPAVPIKSGPAKCKQSGKRVSTVSRVRQDYVCPACYQVVTWNYDTDILNTTTWDSHYVSTTPVERVIESVHEQQPPF